MRRGFRSGLAGLFCVCVGFAPVALGQSIFNNGQSRRPANSRSTGGGGVGPSPPGELGGGAPQGVQKSGGGEGVWVCSGFGGGGGGGGRRSGRCRRSRGRPSR